MNLILQIASSEEEIAAICLQRAEAYQHSGLLNPERIQPTGWREPVDEDAQLLAFYCDGVLAGSVRIEYFDNLKDIPHVEEFAPYLDQLHSLGSYAYCSRLVVAPAFAGRIFGNAIIKQGIKICQERGVRTILILSLPQLVRWYQKLGFILLGPGGLEPGQQPTLNIVQAQVLLYSLEGR